MRAQDEGEIWKVRAIEHQVGCVRTADWTEGEQVNSGNRSYKEQKGEQRAEPRKERDKKQKGPPIPP